ncbi:MAG: MFS transporter [bacterium]
MKNTFINKNFLLLLTVQTLEQIGDSLILMALIAWVMGMEVGSKTANITILFFWIGLPIILIGPFSGVIIDLFKRKTLLAVATFVKGFFIFLIFVCVKYPNLVPLLYFFVFMKSFSTQFFIPAKSAFMPDIVHDKNLLVRANSISTTAMVITQIMTYAISGMALAEFGPRSVMLVSAILYIPAVLLILLIGSTENQVKRKIESLQHIVNDLAAGFKFMLKEEKIQFMTRRVFFMMIAVIVFYISLTGGVLDHMLASGDIKLKSIGALGFMQAVLGAGLVAGVIMTDKLVKKISEKKIISYIFPIFGLLIVGLYFYANYYFLLVCAFLGGMAGVMILSIAETVVQKETPENMRGRIFSAYYVFRNTGPLVAAGIAGILIRFMNEEKVMLVSGLSLVTYGLFNLLGLLGVKRI